MAGSSFNIRLEPLKEIDVPMTRVINGKPATSGIIYTKPEDRELWGPYKTGCEGADQCYEFWMEQERVDLEIEVLMEQAAPNPWAGHWIADELSQRLNNGDIVREWPDMFGGSPLTDANLNNTHPAKYLANACNGRSAIALVKGDNSYIMSGLTRSSNTDLVTPSDVTVYLVLRVQPGHDAYMSVQTSGAYRFIAFDRRFGSTQLAYRTINGGVYNFPDSRRIDGQSSIPSFIVNDSWNVWAFRLSLLHGKIRQTCNSVEFTLPWPLIDVQAIAECRSGYVDILAGKEGITNTLCALVAEMKIVHTSHTDAEMDAETQRLQQYYGI